MKVISLEEARANLQQYANDCQSSPVVVTVEGKPAFELIPIRPDDGDFVDRLLADNEAFRQLMQYRHKESERGNVSSLEAVRERMKRLPE